VHIVRRVLTVTQCISWSLCVLRLSVGHERESCRNGWTDRDGGWGVDSWLPENQDPQGRGTFGEGNTWAVTMPCRHTRGRYSKPYSQGAADCSSDVVSGYYYCSNLFITGLGLSPIPRYNSHPMIYRSSVNDTCWTDRWKGMTVRTKTARSRRHRYRRHFWVTSLPSSRPN